MQTISNAATVSKSTVTHVAVLCRHFLLY